MRTPSCRSVASSGISAAVVNLVLRQFTCFGLTRLAYIICVWSVQVAIAAAVKQASEERLRHEHEPKQRQHQEAAIEEEAKAREQHAKLLAAVEEAVPTATAGHGSSELGNVSSGSGGMQTIRSASPRPGVENSDNGGSSGGGGAKGSGNIQPHKIEPPVLSRELQRARELKAELIGRLDGVDIGEAHHNGGGHAQDSLPGDDPPDSVPEAELSVAQSPAEDSEEKPAEAQATKEQIQAQIEERQRRHAELELEKQAVPCFSLHSLRHHGFVVEVC